MGTPELSRKVPISEQGGLPKSPSCVTILNIMKKVDNKPIKMRNKLNPSEFYWLLPEQTKEIDGVQFVAVLRNIAIRETPFWMRKDSLEKVRNV